MKKVAYVFSNARNVSAQEVAYRILGLPLHFSNFTNIWIPSGFPETRIRILKAKEKLQTLNDDKEDIFATNIIDRYSARPSEVQQLCLADFAMWYTVSNQSNDDSDEIQDKEQPEPVDSSINIDFQQEPNFNENSPRTSFRLSQMSFAGSAFTNRTDSDHHTDLPKTIVIGPYGTMRKRTSPAVIRYHQSSQSRNPELYYYNRMLLFMPWKK